MKYIFLLSLFIISFTLIYTTTLEFLGLVLFFVVNTIYSALLGMDLSTFFSDLLRGRQGQTPRWVFLLVAIMVIGLGMNFASSVMTMMTLGNLKYQFGSKGEKILFSPDSRKKMDIIEGLFVASIVLITVVSFRIYFSPTEMVTNVFQWVNENVSEFVLTWGHFVMCLVALGLGLTLKGQFDKDVRDKDGKDYEKNKHTIFSANSDHDAFIFNFNNLFYILMALVIMSILPSFVGIAGIDYMRDLYVDKEVSLYTILLLFFMILGFSITGELNKTTDDKDDKEDYKELIAASYSLFSLFLVTMVVAAASYFGVLGDSTLFTNSIYTILSVAMLGSGLGLSDKIDSIGKETPNDITNTQNVYYKVLMSLMVIVPGITFIFLFLGFLDSSSEQPWVSRITEMFTNLTNIANLNVIEAFSIIKTFLLMMAVIYAGLTINQYDKIRDTVDKDEYRRYHMKDIFGSFISFLMLTVAVSLFNHRSITGIMTVLVDYAAPIAILIIVSLLVVYTNEIALLSRKVPIAEIKIDPEEEAKKYAKTITKEVANAKAFDGSDKPKI